MTRELKFVLYVFTFTAAAAFERRPKKEVRTAGGVLCVFPLRIYDVTAADRPTDRPRPRPTSTFGGGENFTAHELLSSM